MLPLCQTHLLQYIQFMVVEVNLCFMDIIAKLMTITYYIYVNYIIIESLFTMAFKCCLLAAQMTSFTSM